MERPAPRLKRDLTVTGILLATLAPDSIAIQNLQEGSVTPVNWLRIPPRSAKYRAGRWSLAVKTSASERRIRGPDWMLAACEVQRAIKRPGDFHG